MAASLDRIKFAETLVESDPDEAHRIGCAVLDDEPDNALALFLIAYIYSKAERYGLAYTINKRIVQLAPHRDQAWCNLGMCLESMDRHAEARECFEQAAKRDPKNVAYPANIALTYQTECRYELALKWADKALQMDPTHKPAMGTVGFASLALGDWARGWKGYESCLGGKFRNSYCYGDEPVWDGVSRGTVVVYGEQGIGDEIMIGSMLADAAKHATIVYDCHPRLANLFKRSFPFAEVHGTRKATALPWLVGRTVDYNIAGMSLGQHFRPTPQSCPGTPFLKADPDRVYQWKALFESWGKRPKIGLCWSGGGRHTGIKGREMGLEAFRAVIETLDADFVSLQYKDPTKEIEASGLTVRHFARAVEAQDYDECAGLVGALDLVIGVNTSAHHLAGGLGVPSVVFVPTHPLWLYARDRVEFYGSWTLFRQRPGETWERTVARWLDDTDLGRVRSARGAGVSHVLPVCDRPRIAAGRVQSAVAGAVAGL
jgi:hypothetical protein